MNKPKRNHLLLILLSNIFLINSEVSTEELTNYINNKIILCTGPSLGRRSSLISNTENDQKLITFKKIFLSTNDMANLDVTFNGKLPICEYFEPRGHQLDCLNCVISSIKNAINDPESLDDDIILFKHESVYINDMHLINKSISKILEGYDLVVRHYIGQHGGGSNSFYHTGHFFLRVKAARDIFKNLSLVQQFTNEFNYCEEYFTKFIVSKIKNIFQINYNHCSWKDTELGFYHIPRDPQPWIVYWDKKNYHSIYDDKFYKKIAIVPC